MTRAEVKAEFERFAANLAMTDYPPITVREGKDHNSLIIENFPYPREHEYHFQGIITPEASS